jgi:hypothetical protein
LNPLPLAEARERAIRLLSDGYAYDALTEEEFEWRLGQLNRAASGEAVDVLVADLVAPPAAQAQPVGALAPASDEGRIVAIMSETRREGQWWVPRSLRVTAVMSDLRLDLRYASVPPGCTIDLTACMAQVTIIVPPEMSVDMDVSAFMAAARNDSVRAGGFGAPHLRIKGGAMMAEVRVKTRP